MKTDKYLRWKPCLCKSQLQTLTETLRQEHQFLLSTPYSAFCASHNIKQTILSLNFELQYLISLQTDGNTVGKFLPSAVYTMV